MRIAYVCQWDFGYEDGVAKKIMAQVEAWRAAGHEVDVFTLSPTDALVRRQLVLAPRLARAVRRRRPDALYVRYDLLPPSLARLSGEAPTIVEVNTTESHVGSRFRRSRVRRAYSWWLRRRLLGRAAGIVFTSRTMAAAPAYRGLAVSTTVIANGADPARLAPFPEPANERPRLIFLGRLDQPWQGADKVVELARLNPDWDVDLVGGGAEKLGDLPPNARAHGFLPAGEYEPLLRRADVGVGTLALHRKAMDEVAALKVREYLLHGIPTLLGNEDTDFPGALPWYLLRIPNAEDGIERANDEIREFVARVRGRRVPRAEAEALVGSPAKEAARLAFIRSCVEDAAGARHGRTPAGPPP